MKLPLFACALLCALTLTALAQEDPAHQELRALRDDFVARMNSGDLEGQIALLHPNVVVTWHNAETSRGREGVREYLDRMLHGPKKVVESYSARVTVDELSILYGGDTAISFGGAQEHFQLASGRSLDLHARWTATLVKEGGHWLIASLHSSDNLFDNAILSQTKLVIWLAAAGGIVLGGLGGWFLKRRRAGA